MAPVLPVGPVAPAPYISWMTMSSPEAGVSTSVTVVPETEKSVVGACVTPLTNTIRFVMTSPLEIVYVLVVPSPTNARTKMLNG